MKVTYKGQTYRLKEEVVIKFKKGVIGLACASFLSIAMLGAVISNEIKEEDVEYEEVFISSYHSEHTSAVDAITDLNTGVDYRELLPFFESANDVDRAGNIQQGYYLVPIYKGGK